MSDMDQKLDLPVQENATKMIGYIKKAAEMTHTVIMAEKKASKAISAIQMQDKSEKWVVLQEYLKEYGRFINDTTPVTGVCVYPVNGEFYDEVNLQEINRQLQIIVGIVYLKEAVRAAINATFKECLKGLLEQSGLFTETQLSLL